VAPRAAQRLFRLIWGEQVDHALRPLLGVDVAMSLAGTTLFPFIGIWAIDKLGASQIELSLAFLVGAAGSVASGFAGGHISDHVGRRPVILTVGAGAIFVPIAFALVGHDVLLGLAAVALFSILGSASGGAEDAMVADLVPEGRRTQGYASVRVAKNLGVSFGPPLGGLLLLGTAWPRLFGGVALLSAAAWVLAWRLLPARGRYTPKTPPERGSFAAVRRDRPFIVFIAAMSLASATYVAFDSLLAISLVRSHGVAPATWGFLVVVNPILVTLVQLRLTRLTERIPAAVKLGVAMPLMGLPFTLLRYDASVPFIILLVAIFVVGEMLWVPTSQAVVAGFAPSDIRGAYMGAFGSASQVAWALTPFAGLQIRAAFGDAAMWDVMAALSLVAAAAGAIVARGRDVRSSA
jgi:predicted MFS family arabinose efflux permease